MLYFPQCAGAHIFRLGGFMDVHTWDTPIRAAWHKSNTLVDYKYTPDVLVAIIQEEETNHRWHVMFKELAALKIIVGDNAHWSLEPLPPDGGFFTISGSPWLSALGLSENNAQRLASHYVICCKRELIEIAAYDVTFTPE